MTDTTEAATEAAYDAPLITAVEAADRAASHGRRRATRR